MKVGISGHTSSHPWNRVSRGHPCPICGKPDWCSISAEGDFAICMRISDGAIKETQNGGYLHRLKDSVPFINKSIIIQPNRPSRHDLPDLAKYYHHQASRKIYRIEKLSKELGLPCWSIQKLRVGWAEQRKAFSFPMRNASSEIIGIRLRSTTGGKSAVKGSREGLFIPTQIGNPDSLVVSEGTTDCAALLSLGFSVIGRPSCTGGVQLIVKWVKIHRPSEVIVVSDADEPGIRGANKLASLLAVYVPSVRIIQPPDGIKDARAWVNSGATKLELEAAINSAPVLRLRVKGTTDE